MAELAQALKFLDGVEQDCDNQSYLMLNGDRSWTVNNSSLEDYSHRAFLFDDDDGLTDLITDRIGSAEDNVGLDVAAGSNAQALRDLLDSGVLRQALATNYHDRRPRKVAKDPRLGHIKGNLTRAATWAKVITWQRRHAPDGFALVMHRPVGGLQDLSPQIYRGAAHLMLDMVRPGGLMFTQVPRLLVNRRDPTALQELCQSVRERPDVTEVITARRHPVPRHRDWADTYAVILKEA